MGAEMLGFNFYPKSPRFITPALCTSIAYQVRLKAPNVLLVGVFVNMPAEQIIQILDTCGLDLAQLSGDEPVETLLALGERAFKALRIASHTDLEIVLQQYPPRSLPPAFLLDAPVTGQYGGTGHTADWNLARDAAHQFPILLAGGLTPENVTKAIEQVCPWGVDVASGVEAEPGIKDHRKMAAFIRKAHGEE